MNGTIFIETLRRNWRQIMWWGLGMGMLGAMVILIVPNADMLQEYAKLVKAMPESMIQAFGVQNAEEVATPAGFLNFSYFSYGLIVMATYAAVAGLNVTANEEDAKIMDVLLSLPVARWRVVLERFLAYALIIVAILVVTFLSLWGTLFFVPDFKMDTSILLQSTLNMLPSTLLVLAVTLLFAAFFRRKGTATALAAVVIMGSYFLDVIGRAASASIANTLRVISFYTYYDSGAVIQNGLNWGNVLVLVVAAVVCVGGGIWAFQRRDIGL
jgi:beta-exotoxin I transport system permease protein